MRRLRAAQRGRRGGAAAGLLAFAVALPAGLPGRALATDPPAPALSEGPGERSGDAEPGEAPPNAAEPDQAPQDDGGQPLAAIPVKPPRISGTYLGMTIWGASSWAFSPNLEIDQSRALPGGGGAVHLGQAVFPWMTLGLDASGGFYFNRDTLFMEGGLLVELGFYPVPRYPFSFRGGFGFGAGLILDDRVEERGGVGGARFMGGLRYEFFPTADRKRPKRAGGWSVGPELAWRGFPPAAKGLPMSHTVLLGLYFGFFWGE